MREEELLNKLIKDFEKDFNNNLESDLRYLNKALSRKDYFSIALHATNVAYYASLLKVLKELKDKLKFKEVL